MATLHSVALALMEQVRRNPVPRAQQTFKAFAGLAVMIVLPTLLVWWARKRYRP